MVDRFNPNKAQIKAIEFGIDGPLKVVAGAGTGKTEVLTRRFVHLVEKYRMQPHRILALTFTKKAAAEMQGRITRALLDKRLINKSEAALLSWIGNFHSICLKLLRQSPLMVGLDPSFKVIEEAEQRLVFAGVVDDFLNKRLDTATNPDSFEDLMVERADEFVENVLRVVNRLKSRFITPENLKGAIGDTLCKQYRDVEKTLNETVANEALHPNSRRSAERRLESLADSQAYERLFLEAVYEMYTAYQEELEVQDCLDFNDLIFHAYRLAQVDPSLRQKFDYILVDEFQDTDYGQYKLLEALSGDFKRVTVVGDKKQSIYEWREARIENIENFPGEMIALEENYRSFGEILDSANFFIHKTMPAEPALRPASEGGRGRRAHSAQVRLVRAGSREAEARYVANEIRRLMAVEKYKPGEIIILMRSVLPSQAYEDALKACRIAYVTVGSCGFYDLRETKDLLALLRLLSNPFDDLSMTRVLQSPIVGLSDATLYAICRRKNETESSIYDAMKSSGDLLSGFLPETQARLRRLVDAIDELANKRATLSLGEVVSEALNRTEYLKYLSSVEGPRGPRFNNVSRLYKMAAAFEERRPSERLEGFLSYMDTAISSGVAETPGDVRADIVQIMSIHQAKGLEFPVVFVVNLGAKTFPLRFRQDSYGYEEKFGVFVARLPRGNRTARYEAGFGGNIEEHLRQRHSLEENRIMYVGMTRARNLLYLTTCAEKEEEANDFFQCIEELASRSPEGPAPSSADFLVDSAVSVGAHDRVSSQEKETGVTLVNITSGATEMSESALEESETEESAAASLKGINVEEIKELAENAVKRISVTPMTVIPRKATVELSYSRLALFRHCPMKYALRYLYNLPLPPYEDAHDENYPSDRANAYELGNLLHETLMLYHRRRKIDARADATRIFADLCRALHCSKRMLQAGKAMLKKYTAAPLSRLDTLYEEKEFHWRITAGSHDIMLMGKIDRVHKVGDSVKIVDYKTGAHDENHRLQLGIYRLAMESVLGEHGILTSNYYLSTGEEVEREFSESELREIGESVIEDAAQIADENFRLGSKDGVTRDCLDCEYESFCFDKPLNSRA